MRHPLYLLYGLSLLTLVGVAEYRGFYFASVNEVRDVPRTIRDNPGAYRPHYSGYNRYFGGK
ncbi:MAG: hypothetical protein NTY38_15545 [Acidobacteria bacterium]|nr:hypothetical protein [Acidobacteriota bacterium]